MTAELASPKPRRRFWQYSFWTYMVLLTVFYAWLGVELLMPLLSWPDSGKQACLMIVNQLWWISAAGCFVSWHLVFGPAPKGQTSGLMALGAFTGLFLAAAFYFVGIPMPRAIPPRLDEVVHAFVWLPVAGFAIGLFVDLFANLWALTPLRFRIRDVMLLTLAVGMMLWSAITYSRLCEIVSDSSALERF